MGLDKKWTYSCDAPGCKNKLELDENVYLDEIKTDWLAVTLVRDESWVLADGRKVGGSAGVHLAGCCSSHLCAAFANIFDKGVSEYLMNYKINK